MTSWFAPFLLQPRCLPTCPFHVFSVLCSLHFYVCPFWFSNLKTIQRSFNYRIMAGFYCDGAVHFLSNEPNTKNLIDEAEEIPSASEDPGLLRQGTDKASDWVGSLEGGGSRELAGGFTRLGAGVVWGLGRGRCRRGSGARLWSCRVWRSPGFYSAVPSFQGPIASYNSLFISQYHNFFVLLVFCCHVCKHRCSTFGLVQRVFHNAEALLA